MKTNIISVLKTVLLLMSFSMALAGDQVKTSPNEPTLQVVNINTATVDQLVTLPRVGPAIAKRIIEFREQNQGFKKAEELMNVKGIGAKTYEKLKDRIKVK